MLGLLSGKALVSPHNKTVSADGFDRATESGAPFEEQDLGVRQSFLQTKRRGQTRDAAADDDDANHPLALLTSLPWSWCETWGAARLFSAGALRGRRAVPEAGLAAVERERRDLLAGGGFGLRFGGCGRAGCVGRGFGRVLLGGAPHARAETGIDWLGLLLRAEVCAGAAGVEAAAAAGAGTGAVTGVAGLAGSRAEHTWERRQWLAPARGNDHGLERRHGRCRRTGSCAVGNAAVALDRHDDDGVGTSS